MEKSTRKVDEVNHGRSLSWETLDFGSFGMFLYEESDLHSVLSMGMARQLKILYHPNVPFFACQHLLQT
jgi:hypothetical protein